MLDELRTDIARLVSMYEQQKKRADALEALLSDRTEELHKCREQITDLNLQIDNLHLMYAFNACDDSKEAKRRIDRILKEIDKCIELLES